MMNCDNKSHLSTGFNLKKSSYLLFFLSLQEALYHASIFYIFPFVSSCLATKSSKKRFSLFIKLWKIHVWEFLNPEDLGHVRTSFSRILRSNTPSPQPCGNPQLKEGKYKILKSAQSSPATKHDLRDSQLYKFLMRKALFKWQWRSSNLLVLYMLLYVTLVVGQLWSSPQICML